VAVGSIFCVVAVFFPVPLMSLFIGDPLVIQYGTEYLQIIGITYLLSAVSFAFTYVSRSVHRTKIPMVASIVALSVNTWFNYLLIYGKFGFPELGVQGAALATVLARIIEIVLMLLFIYKGPRKHPLAASMKELIDWDFKQLKEILKKGIPVFINDSLWALGNTVFYIAFGYLGAASIAAIQIAFILSDCFWAFFIGVGSAASVIVGNEIGRNQFDLAWKLSLRLIKISCVLSIIATAFMILLMKPMGSFYNITPETKILLERSIFVIAIYLLPRNINYLLNVGILRSGGDSKYAMLLDVITVWGIAVPLSFVAVLVWGLPIYWVIGIVYAHEIIKILFLIHRYRTRKWLKNVIV
jgi:putative MATE family efflux protein